MMMDGRDDFPKWNSRLSDELPLSVPLPDLSKLPSSPSSSSRRDRDSRGRGEPLQHLRNYDERGSAIRSAVSREYQERTRNSELTAGGRVNHDDHGRILEEEVLSPSNMSILVGLELGLWMKLLEMARGRGWDSKAEGVKTK